MANIANIRRLADYLETEVEDDEFNMAVGLTACGTVGCIAGHAIKLFRPEIIPAMEGIVDGPWGASFMWKEVEAFAGRALGLHAYEASQLFLADWNRLTGRGDGYRYDSNGNVDLSKATAVKVLRELANLHEQAELHYPDAMRAVNKTLAALEVEQPELELA